MDSYEYRERIINGHVFLPEKAAQKYANRGRTALWKYRRNGWVAAHKLRLPNGQERWYYQRSTLRLAARQAAAAKSNQRHVAGTGRGNKGPMADEALTRARERAEQKQAATKAAATKRRAEMRARAEAAERAEDELAARQVRESK